RPVRRRRRVLHRPARAIGPIGGTPRDSRDLSRPANCRGRWTDELWSSAGGCLASGRRLCRPHPQGGKARGTAGGAVEQVRISHQCRDREEVRPRGDADPARARRRGDTTVTDPNVFRSGREFAAWLGLVPRQNSTGGKTRLGGITKRGNRYLRRLLINGAS